VRTVGTRPLEDSGQCRRFGGREVLDRLAEEIGRCRLHAVVAVAEVHEVRVEGEDLLLAVSLFDLDGQQRLLDLAAPGLFRRQIDLAGELHRECRAADTAAFQHVAQRRAQDTRGIDAAVLEEVRVLGRQDRLLQ